MTLFCSDGQHRYTAAGGLRSDLSSSLLFSYYLHPHTLNTSKSLKGTRMEVMYQLEHLLVFKDRFLRDPDHFRMWQSLLTVLSISFVFHTTAGLS